MTRLAHFGVVVIMLGGVRCSSAPTEPAVAGFSVTEVTTHFAMGDVIEQTTNGDFRRTRGSVGSYLVNTATSGSLGAMDGAPAESFSGALPDHEALLASYYGGLEFPSSQLEGVSTSRIYGIGGTVSYFQTTYTRAVEGVHIAGSYIRASCLDSKRCIDEYIFWPPIPGNTMSAAREFKAMLGTPDGARFRSGLPNGGAGGEVTIHHSEWKVHTTVFVVTFDVPLPNETLSYDRRGVATVPPN